MPGVAFLWNLKSNIGLGGLCTCSTGEFSKSFHIKMESFGVSNDICNETKTKKVLRVRKPF